MAVWMPALLEEGIVMEDGKTLSWIDKGTFNTTQDAVAQLPTEEGFDWWAFDDSTRAWRPLWPFGAKSRFANWIDHHMVKKDAKLRLMHLGLRDVRHARICVLPSS